MKKKKITFDTGDLCAWLAVVAVSLVFIGNICSTFCPLNVAYTIILVGFACLIVLLIVLDEEIEDWITNESEEDMEDDDVIESFREYLREKEEELD